MATLHLICGFPCAGKTTFAKQLEQTHSALRLTPDEWHTDLFGQDEADPEHETRHDKIEALLWRIAARALTLDTNVILDFGFWGRGRGEREDYRSRAAKLGARSELHVLDVPKDVLLARLAARNAQRPPDTFFIPTANLEEWIELFELPAQEELEPREVSVQP